MDSDDEREEESPTWRGIPASVILINVFDTSRNTAKVGLAATSRLVRQYLRSSSSYLVGVSLFGTEESSTSAFGSQSVVDVFPLTVPSLDEFKNLRDVDLSKHKPAPEFKLSDALWHCSKMFTNCKKQLSSRSVVILTRLDEPPIVADQKPTLKRVVDLVDANIEVKVINIAEDSYKIDPFYEKFLIEANKGQDYILPSPIWDAQEIEKILHQQSHRHLAVARLNFQLGEGVAIGVGVYNLLSRSTYQKKINLERTNNAIVSSFTKTMKVVAGNTSDFTSPMDVDEENAPKKVPILKSEILHYQEYGGERIEFTEEEKKKMHNPFGPPMMKLLGFKPANIMCKEKWFLKTGYFLFPNEEKIEGSTTAFKALHQACVETGMVGISVLCTRINAKPIIAALSPCTHPLGLDVEIGFDVIPIPFVENKRDLPPVEDLDESNSSGEQKELMKDILQSLKFDYKADMFENPKQQSEYRAIEAKALDEEELEPFEDTTKPDQSIFENLPEDRFEELFGPFTIIAPKRPAATKESGPINKKFKGEDIDAELLQEKIQCRTVHQFTNDQLKKILKKYKTSNIPAITGLKKNELVDLVYKHCGN